MELITCLASRAAVVAYLVAFAASPTADSAGHSAWPGRWPSPMSHRHTIPTKIRGRGAAADGRHCHEARGTSHLERCREVAAGPNSQRREDELDLAVSETVI